MSRLRRLLAFGLVGLSGMVVNTLALWLLTDRIWDHHYLLAAVIATQVSTAWNLLWTELFVFSGAKPGSQLSRGIKFFLLNNVALLLRIPLLALLVDGLGMNVLVANVLTLVLLFLVRFVIADAAIYARPAAEVEKRPMRIVVAPEEAAATGCAEAPADSRRASAPSLPVRHSRRVDDRVACGAARTGVLQGSVGRQRRGPDDPGRPGGTQLALAPERR